MALSAQQIKDLNDAFGKMVAALGFQTGGTVNLGTALQEVQSAALPAVSGAGKLLYDNGTAWTTLAAGTAGMFLKSGGAGAPAWAKVDLSSGSEVQNVLAVANGGTGGGSAATARTALGVPATADLAATTNGKGASTVGIEDAGGLITAINVETALAEAFTSLGGKLDSNSNRLLPAPSGAGKVPYDNGTAWTTLAAGTAGMFLKSGGAGPPTWAKVDLSSGSETLNTITAEGFGPVYSISRRVVLGANDAGGVDAEIMASMPWAARILEARVYVEVALAGHTGVLRNATDGGGSALSEAFSTEGTGVKRETSRQGFSTIAAGAPLVFRSSQGLGLTVTIVVDLQRTA